MSLNSGSLKITLTVPLKVFLRIILSDKLWISWLSAQWSCYRELLSFQRCRFILMRYRIQVTTFIHHAIQDTGYNIYSSCDTRYRLQHLFIMRYRIQVTTFFNDDDDDDDDYS